MRTVSIDPFGPDCLTLNDAAKLLPRRPAFSTVWRWCTVGVAGVRLQTIHIGRQRFTSREALREFFAAVDQAKQQQEAAAAG